MRPWRDVVPSGTRMGVLLWYVFPGFFFRCGRFRFPRLLAFLRCLSLSVFVSVTLVVSPALCTRCCLSSRRFPNRKGQFRESLSWHVRMHQVAHLLRRRGGYPEGFFLIWRMLLKFELQVREFV